MPNLQTLPFSYFCFVGKPGINLEFDFRVIILKDIIHWLLPRYTQRVKQHN